MVTIMDNIIHMNEMTFFYILTIDILLFFQYFQASSPNTTSQSFVRGGKGMAGYIFLLIQNEFISN